MALRAASACLPQLIFIHTHQLFRIQYTCFELGTVNIDWWICINFCLVVSAPCRRVNGAVSARRRVGAYARARASRAWASVWTSRRHSRRASSSARPTPPEPRSSWRAAASSTTSRSSSPRPRPRVESQELQTDAALKGNGCGLPSRTLFLQRCFKPQSVSVTRFFSAASDHWHRSE